MLCNFFAILAPFFDCNIKISLDLHVFNVYVFSYDEYVHVLDIYAQLYLNKYILYGYNAYM